MRNTFNHTKEQYLRSEPGANKDGIDVDDG